MKTRYAITCVQVGFRVLAFANSKYNHFDTQQEAENRLAAIRTRRPKKEVEAYYGDIDQLRVDPIECNEKGEAINTVIGLPVSTAQQVKIRKPATVVPLDVPELQPLSGMSVESAANLRALKRELRQMQTRLENISAHEFDDMEGADQPDFSISEALHAGTASAAKCLDEMLKRVEACERGEWRDPDAPPPDWPPDKYELQPKVDLFGPP